LVFRWWGNVIALWCDWALFLSFPAFISNLDFVCISALVQFKDVSTGFPDFETRVIVTFYHNNSKYHLKARGVNEELLAIVSSITKKVLRNNI
jgi:hypothetical protein